MGVFTPAVWAVAVPLAVPVTAPVSQRTNEPILFQPEERRLAHHGAEGVGSGAAGAATTAAPLLQTRKMDVSDPITDSLWGNLLLSLAYQRDAEIQRLVKKLGRVNAMTLLSVAGVSALGMAQSVTSLVNLDHGTAYEVVNHGAGDHIHTHAENMVPSVMGMVGSGATLATLGTRAVLNRRYTKRLSQRQDVIKTRVEAILTQLEARETDPQEFAPQLMELVGPRATREFLQIWQATHAIDTAQVTP